MTLSISPKHSARKWIVHRTAMHVIPPPEDAGLFEGVVPGRARQGWGTKRRAAFRG
jgi:hypothetical protein